LEDVKMMEEMAMMITRLERENKEREEKYLTYDGCLEIFCGEA
jgi:hypothetical protein